MKFISSIIFIIIGQICSAQHQIDTTISKQILDTLKTENYRIKKYNKRLVYENRLLLKGSSVDTTYFKTDSTIISYLTKEGILIKRIIKTYRRPNCKSYETEELFNDKGLLEYLEFWTCDCRTQKDVAENEIVFQKLLSRQERFIYDSIGRVTSRIFIYSSHMPGPRRYDYQYDSKGKATIQMRRISENEFWD